MIAGRLNFGNRGGFDEIEAEAGVGGWVWGGEDGADDDDAVSTGGEDGGEGEEVDAADAEDGDWGVGVDGADVEGADGEVVWFGGGGEERAEADAVCAFSEGGLGLGEAVGGFSDEDAWACELPGFGDGEVVLADVGAFDACGASGFRVVIDDEGDVGGFGERVEGAGGGDDIVLGP